MWSWEFWARVVVLALFILFAAHYARAHIPGVEHTEWLSYLFNRDGSNCCDVSEAQILDDDKWLCFTDGNHDCQIKLNDVWRPVPPNRIVNPKGNRTGFAYVWFRTDVAGQRVLWCFMPGVPQT